MLLGLACGENQTVGVAGTGRLVECREWLREMGAEVPIDSPRRGIFHRRGVPEWPQCRDSHLYSLGLNFQKVIRFSLS